MGDGLSKLTVEVPTDEHTELMNKLYHGQLSKIVRKFFYCLLLKIREGKWNEVVSWAFDDADLTLPGKEGD